LSDPRHQAEAVFSSMTLAKKLDYMSAWRVCQTKAEDKALTLPVLPQRPKARRCQGGRHAMWEVAHIVAVVRASFYAAMASGMSPDECASTALERLPSDCVAA